MKKINLKSIQSKELLSREQLKSVVGGLKPAPCGYYMGIWGCIPK